MSKIYQVVQKLFRHVTEIGSVLVFGFIVLFLLPVYCYRYVLSKLAPWVKPGFGNILSTHSALFARVTTERAATFNISICMEVQGKLNYDRIVILISQRMVFLTNRAGKLVYPELQQHYVSWMGYPFWKWEANFKIEEHVYKMNSTEVVGVNESFDQGMSLLQKPFLNTKSPWEVVLVDNCESFMVFSKFHHSLADGYALFNALVNCCDKPAVLIVPTPKEETRRIQKLKDFFNTITSFPPAIKAFLFKARKDATKETTCWDFPVFSMSPKRNFSLSTKIPLSAVKNFGSMENVSVTSVLVACVAGAVRKFLVLNNYEFESTIASSLPLYVSGHPQGLNNSLLFVNFQMPLEDLTLNQRAEHVSNVLTKEKECMSYRTTFALFSLIGGLPQLFFLPPTKFQPLALSIFPGPKEEMTFDGQPLRDMYFSIHGSMIHPAFVNIFTYMGHIRIVLTTDYNVCKTTEEARQFMTYLESEFDDVVKSTSV